MKAHKNLILLIIGILCALLVWLGVKYMAREAWPTNKIDEPVVVNLQTVNPNSLKGKKVLLVYFSWSGTTKDVMTKIQKQTGGDIYELVPSKPYVGSHSEVSQQAKREQDMAYRPDIKNELPNIANYDVIILGYPIWWYEEPMIIDSFLEKVNLQGKIILPFCTSGGSTVDKSVANIQKLAPTASVVKGLTLTNGSGTRGIEEWLRTSGF